MARLNDSVRASRQSTRDTSVDVRSSTPASSHPQQHDYRKQPRTTSTLTPADDTSSDKENQDDSVVPLRNRAKSKSKSSPMMNTVSLPTPPPPQSSQRSSSKRRRIGEYSISDTNNNRGSQMEVNGGDTINEFNKYYDPDQAPEERQKVRKEYRNLQRRFHDTRDQLLAANNNGLCDVVQQANSLMEQVRQTADATIDSRLLVSASDLTLKKTTQVVLGDSAAGVDLDEFVSKTISFMRYGRSTDNGDTVASSSTNRAHGRREVIYDEENDGDGDEGDALDWELLGSQVCFPTNTRPPVPSFLLGILSSQKRVRASQPRRPRVRVETEIAESKPENIAASDLGRSKASNVTTLCNAIHSQLNKVIDDGMANVDEEGNSDMEDDEIQALMGKHHITPDGHVPLFDFALHPQSFGQTVENLFYISFLIREGRVAVGRDPNGLPTLYPGADRTLAERGAQHASKFQAVFSLDWSTWRGLVEVFGIREPLIPHRQYEESIVQPQGWYG